MTARPRAFAALAVLLAVALSARSQEEEAPQEEESRPQTQTATTEAGAVQGGGNSIGAAAGIRSGSFSRPLGSPSGSASRGSGGGGGGGVQSHANNAIESANALRGLDAGKFVQMLPSVPGLKDWITDIPRYFDPLPNGPIASYNVHMFFNEVSRNGQNLNGSYVAMADQMRKDPKTGCWKVAPGDRVHLDSTQKNASGKECKWRASPAWYATNADNEALQNGAPFEYISRPKGNPFLMNVKPHVKNQTTMVYAVVDGVKSNVLCLSTAP